MLERRNYYDRTPEPRKADEVPAPLENPCPVK